MREAVDRAERYARSKSPFLLVGEAGTGRRLLAHHIHRLSGRRGEFIAVDGSGSVDRLLRALVGRLGSGGAVEKAARGTLLIHDLRDFDIELLRLLTNANDDRARLVFAVRPPVAR